MVSRKDPHFLLGLEHARTHQPRVTAWTDPELQRRYDLGYEWARGVLSDGLTFAEFDRLMTERGYKRER